MLLKLIELRDEKRQAQALLEDCLRKAWRRREKRTVVWRPDRREIEISHNDRLWFGSVGPVRNDTTPRYWNPLGRYEPSGTLQIAVEINIPTESNSRRVSGFFARDLETNTVCLMHDGAVGGGRPGIGRSEFLWWSSEQLVPVTNSVGDKRPAILVAPLESTSSAADIARFAETVLRFKDAVAAGYSVNAEAGEAQQRYQDYFDEPAGPRRRRHVRELEYISRHGEIVRTLREWRHRSTSPTERIVKNRYIDLGVHVGGRLVELYEVKTNCERQTLYGAIGQVLVHGDGEAEGARRFLVLPLGEAIPSDVGQALGRANITLIRFEIRGERVHIRT